ncbi:MAG: aldehyde dehydrogenase family protein, partial [Pseudomonadota bacterium]|nr:aldehyde dehydrogenase family protein [Pseudomonadota bacterium]
MQLMDRLADTGLLKHQGYIDGAWVGADQGRTYAVEDPATGVEIGQVADRGGDETRRAIAAAEAAWPAWRKKTAKERAAILRKWFDL